MNESRRWRSFPKIREDNLYPELAALPDEQDCDRRHQTIVEVFCRLPEEPYERFKRLKASRRSFSWFVPPLSTQGLVYPFLPNVRPRKESIQMERFGISILKPHARIIYLSPLLELSGKDHLVYVVAHELAHVIKRHAMHSCGHDNEKAEREAYRTVCSWGFEREATKIEGRRESAESELTDPATIRLPRSAIDLLGLARSVGIGIGPCFPDGEELCLQLHSSGDIELLFKIARRSYRVTVEQYNDGDDDDPSFRTLLLVFIPVADLPKLVIRLNDFVKGTKKSY